jgi:DNA repair protein RadC
MEPSLESVAPDFALESVAPSVSLACEEPAGRLDRFGAAALSDVELLAVLLGGPAGRALDIELLDHVICGRAAVDPRGTGYYSFREAGVL